MQIVVTAGHSDHGKSALIRALAGLDARIAGVPDRRAASDLGLDWLLLPSGRRLAFVDVPGHERFVTTLLAGAGAAPIALFVLAADEGWMSQSAEHLAVIDALGISHGLLVVTRCDLADPAAAIAQGKAQLAKTSLGAAATVAVSSATGAGLAELVAALDELSGTLPVPDPGAAVRIWIDRAVSTAGDGTIVTGTLPAGTVHAGDELVLSPAMRPVRVQDLQSLGEPAAAASGAARLALSIRGAGREPLHRGMALVQPGRWTLTDLIDVRLSGSAAGEVSGGWQPGGPRTEVGSPGQLARAVTLHVGSARVVARVRPLGPGLARLSLTDPLPLHVGDRVLLRDPGSRRQHGYPATAGAMVLDVAPPALTRRGAAAAAARLLASWPAEPGAAELLARHGILRASDLLAMGITDHPVPVTGEWLADPDRWRSLSHQLGEALASHAAAEPVASGMPIDTARAALDLPDRKLVLALAKPPFRMSCGALHITRPAGQEASPALPEPVLAAVRVLRADLAVAPFVSPDADRLRKLGLDVRSIAAAVRAGELMRISEQVVLAPGADAAATEVLAGLEQPFTAAQARQALGTTRRTAIPLLEYLDSAGVTERLPDDRRVLKAKAAGPAGAAPVAAGTGEAAAREAGDPATLPRPATPAPAVTGTGTAGRAWRAWRGGEHQAGRAVGSAETVPSVPVTAVP